MLKVIGASRNAVSYLTANKEGPEQASLWLGPDADKLGVGGMPVTERAQLPAYWLLDLAVCA